MKLQFTRREALLAGAAGAAALAMPVVAQAEAATHEVQMLNKHPENKKLRQVFYPRVQVVNPGDTVNFVATDKTHNSASMDGMIPEGTEEWNGKINKDISVTFDKPGIYGYKCTPHVATGMVGVIVVKGEGMLDNLEAAKGVKQRGKAKKIFEEIWAEIEAIDFEAMESEGS